ncbi:MAG: Mrp/NBP35 family ATP-binding protein [Planctomycetaceae bacterium]
MSAVPSAEQLRSSIAGIIDPEIGRSLGDLDMLKTVTVTDGAGVVQVELPTPAYPDRGRISEAIQQVGTEKFAGLPIEVQFSSKVKGNNSGGTLGLRAANIIAVGSGKGGVGKSTISAALAYGLLNKGARVALLDADVYGPSIPHLVGLKGQPTIKQVQLPDGRTIDRIEPLESDGLKVMSMGFMVSEDQAVIWRGPMLHKWLTQLLHQTDWGELDYLIVDMPPGTGDVALTLSQSVQLAGAVVVCTPQQVALLDAVKAISMFNQVKIPILGMVENMSGDVFGRGGTRAKAEQLGLPCLGEVPINPRVRMLGDEGKISQLYAEASDTAAPLMQVCERTAMQIARNLLERPRMPTLEVL